MLEYATEVFSPQSARLIRQMEKPQRFFTRVALRRCGLRDLNYGARLMKFGIDTLELRRVKQDLITWFKLCSGFYDISVEQILPPRCTRPSRTHHAKFFQRRVPAASSSWYANRTVPIWNSLPADIDLIVTVDSFKEFLDRLDPSSLVNDPKIRLE